MDKLNFTKNLAVIIKGFIAMVMQIIIIRELLIIFNGNELSLGIILAIWLLLEALGSGLLARAFSKSKDNIRAYVILQIFIVFSLPLTIWLARTSKANLGIFYGQIVSLPQMFIICLITLFLFSIFDGLQFFFACRLLSDNKSKGLAVAWAYILEALGMVLGGIIFTYIFLPLLNSFQIAFLLAFLAIISMFFLCFVSRINSKKIILWFLAFMLIINIAFCLNNGISLLHKLSLQKQFPGKNILDYRNSIYGNIIVIQKENQFTFFFNGAPVVSAPVTDIAFAEEFVHLSLLYHPLPKDLLLISSGAGGILNEILKEPVKEVDYAELDPLVIREIKKFPTDLTSKELSSPLVNIIYRDGRNVVKNSDKKYDTIFINITSPTTLQVNRLFTREFYQETKNILKPGGFISARLPGSLTYLNDELSVLNNSIYKTISSVYKYVYVIPGDFNLFLASDSLNFKEIPAQTIISRFRNRNLKTHFLTEFSLNYRLDKSWRDWFFNRLKYVDTGRLINRDFSPRGLFFGLAFAYSLISPETKNIFKFMDRVNSPVIFSAIFLIFLLLFIFSNLEEKNKIAPVITLKLLILISGFCAIAFELILILGFQIIYGYIYSWVGILSGVFMLGLSYGGFTIAKKNKKLINNLAVLLKLQSAIIALSMLLPLLLLFLSKINQEITALPIKAVFIMLSFSAGFLLGAEFSSANNFYFNNIKPTGNGYSQLYAYDLLGAASGAILTAVWLIPVLGIWQTAALMAFLKLMAAIIFVFAARKQVC